MENASGLTNGNSMVIWDCQTGEFFRNQDYRAGYNNFGVPTGMTLWTTYVGHTSDPFFDGHTYIETWTYWGTENTFGKWPTANRPDDKCNVWSDNDICDGDDNHVDNPWDRRHRISYFIDGISYWRKSTSSLLSKSDFDYISFGSGYRSNYKYNGIKMDLGGNGTYDWWGNTRSRDANYRSFYGYFGTDYCSTYTLSFWKNFRDNQNTVNLDSNWIFTPSHIYNAL